MMPGWSVRKFRRSVGPNLRRGVTSFGKELPAVHCQAGGLEEGAGKCLVEVRLGNVGTELLKQNQ